MIINCDRNNPYQCNPNLLDNWYFGNAVNQQEVNEYSSAGYTIDRWRLIDTNTGIYYSYGDLTLYHKGKSEYYTADAILQQPFDYFTSKQLFGKTITVSILTTDNQLIMTTGVLPTTAVTTNTGFNKYEKGLGVGLYKTKRDYAFFTFGSNSTTEDKTILAVKAELGSQQTLAHKENGQWILNEIPNYREQLLRCLEYFHRWRAAKETLSITGTKNTTCIATGFAVANNRARLILNTPVRMNNSSNNKIILSDMAIMSVSGTSFIHTQINDLNPTTILWGVASDHVVLDITVGGAPFTVGSIVYLEYYSYEAHVDLDCNITVY